MNLVWMILFGLSVLGLLVFIADRLVRIEQLLEDALELAEEGQSLAKEAYGKRVEALFAQCSDRQVSQVETEGRPDGDAR